MDDDTQTTAKEYLTPTPETPVTGLKQAEWCEPAPIQAHPD
ncbi:hypothetical protein CRENPOLYSF2_580001 [Crenothrix polyspora]|uniref:Uncharacterized protein n=1 Tax=Crenothrix polyspora TaxID=360316 RepID=A0A1R4HGY9_9GAMM|nr:hypothetical protein CRENPOLYSF2_580001 [Crenothrix polyspora]